MTGFTKVIVLLYINQMEDKAASTHITSRIPPGWTAPRVAWCTGTRL